MRRIVLLVAGAILLWGVAPAAAIETTAFGLDVASHTADGRLHVPLRAGRTTKAEVRVWNKGDAPLPLHLSVAPATVDASGAASMGGDATATAWVRLPSEPVELAAHEQRSVTVEVHGPRKLPGKRATVAIVAEPAKAPPGAAVIERVALTTFLEPAAGAPPSALGVLPWVAGALLLVALVAAARVARQRRRSPS